jgi:hypothetical protein
VLANQADIIAELIGGSPENDTKPVYAPQPAPHAPLWGVLNRGPPERDAIHCVAPLE